MPFESDEHASLTASPRLFDSCPAYHFEGHVDFFGYHPTARGWVFGGWIAHPWPPGHRPDNVSSHFENAVVATHELSTFYFREDVAGRGIGFVFFLGAPTQAAGALLHLEMQLAGATHRIYPTPEVTILPMDGLVRELEQILARSEEGLRRGKLLDLIDRGRPSRTITGFIDVYGYHAAAGGWVFAGWVTSPWRTDQRPDRLNVSFDLGEVEGRAIGIIYPRSDLKGAGEGAIFFLPASSASLGPLCSLTFEIDGLRWSLFPGPPVQRLREQDLVALLRPLAVQAGPGRDGPVLLGMLNRRPFGGEDTMATLEGRVYLEFDDAIVCEPDGLVLIGWYLAKPGVVRGMRVRCGGLTVPFDPREGVAINRPDVLEAFGARHGFDEPRCGFVFFVPHAFTRDDRVYIEVETVRHEVAFRNVPAPKLRGMSAIRRILECVDVRFGDVPRAFERVAGPAVEMLNRGRLSQPLEVAVVDYGKVPTRPTYSVIVPLYGRLDFIEYQTALFSEHPGRGDVEWIYVLDDPPKRREAQYLCTSVHERFGVPLRLVMLDRNLGFAPANNVGLRHAHGTYVAFLNSDVFPGTLDWLERLTDQLRDNKDIGVIGPMLLFEDGSVQHRGIRFRRLREFGDWFFAYHEAKGMRHSGPEDARAYPASPAPAWSCGASWPNRWAASMKSTRSAISRIPTSA